MSKCTNPHIQSSKSLTYIKTVNKRDSTGFQNSSCMFQVTVPALSNASMVLPVPEWPGGTASPVLLWLPHIRDASGLKERKRRVKAHRAIRERSSIPPAAFSALDIGCEGNRAEKKDTEIITVLLFLQTALLIRKQSQDQHGLKTKPKDPLFDGTFT